MTTGGVSFGVWVTLDVTLAESLGVTRGVGGGRTHRLFCGTIVLICVRTDMLSYFVVINKYL